MASSIKKRGQKIVRKFSRVSSKAREESKEHIKENLIARVSHIRGIKLLILEWCLLVVGLVMLAITQAFWSGTSYAGDVFVEGGSYTEATIGPVNSMNPLFAMTSSEKVLSKLMFSTLTTVDYSGNIGMGLLESLTAAQNGKVWKATLKKGLKWSDGADISNEDVMFTIDLIQNPLVNSIYSSSLKGVKVEEDENGHIIFTLPSAYADFASALEFPIVPKHELEDTQPQTLVEDDFSNAPVVSGPFMFNALQTGAGNNVTVFLSANPNYYRGKPMLNSFAVHTYDDKASVISALNSGAVTATAELAGSEASEVTSTSYVRQDSGINSGAFMFFNTSSDVVKKREMRTAIRQGIDLITVRTAAPGTVMLDYPLIESQIKLTTYQKIPKYNFDAAKEKIATLSAGKELVLNVATVNSGYLPAVTDALKTQLELLGFNVNVTVYEETQEFIGNIIAKRNYDILVYEIELGADPDLLPYYHSSQANTAGLNLSNYRNALADDLLIGARETLDETMRILKYETFLQHWVYDVPAIGLYQANMTYLYNKNARAFSNNVRLVTPIDRFSDVMNFAATKATKNKTP
ncbi:hypothetical protein IJS18_02460 [Candidatus Saccharibacteria bacterium]|nr:hypothetical protein [Candidatus Saccharibacteria bacterium]